MGCTVSSRIDEYKERPCLKNKIDNTTYKNPNRAYAPPCLTFFVSFS